MKPNNNFNILIIDDEKFNIELVAIYLQEEGYKVSFSQHPKKALQAIKSKKFDLILLDINMPELNGFELCSILKKDPLTKDIPIIFLTAQTSIEYISKAFEVGGIDYITKPFNAAELKARVKTHLQNIQYLQEIQEKQKKLAQLSITDPLTKLYNSLYFDSQIKLFQKKEENFWIIYISIDKFDKINSLYGFYKANKLLKIFANILQENTLNTSISARLHGVNFAILLKEYDDNTIKNIYNNISKTMKENNDINNVINFYTILYKGTYNKPITTIYKKIQNNLDLIKQEATPYKVVIDN